MGEGKSRGEGEEQGDDLIAGEAEEGFWGGAEELVGEAEEAVGDQVEMEELALEQVAMLEGEEDGEGEKLEGDFHRNRGPDESADIVSPATTGVEATDAPERERDGNEDGEAIAGDALVADDSLHDFDTCPTAG